MIRKGKYTKKISTATKLKRHGKRLKRQTKGRWQWFNKLSKPKKAMVIAAPFVAFLVLTPILTYLYYAYDISNQERLMNRNNTGVVLTDISGKEVYSVGRAKHREMVPLDKISDHTKQALIASEDKNFYEHSGFSVTGFLRAFYGTVTSQRAYGGGSTITQQLAKNTLLSSERSFLRKYQELAVSIAIEQQYTKDEILQMYLNSVYFGESAFGIKDATRSYFDKSPDELDLAESAMLIGLLPAPNAYSPITGDPALAKERQTTVLSRMVENNVISQEQKDEALAVKLTYADGSESTNSPAPHFTEMVLNQLYERYGEEKAMRSGYQVQTTLDLDMQSKLQQNIDNHISFIQMNQGSNASGVAIDPTSGEIRALVGSADWDNEDWGKVNMVTTPRQPGSSFKPIYYSAALADGVITPATIIEDRPTDFNGYKPLNADRSFRGDVSVRTALNLSLNIPAVKVVQRLGLDRTKEAASDLGISTIDPEGDYGYSLALGSAEASLLEMTHAYTAFANQGKQYETSAIKQIKNKYDRTIFTTKPEVHQAISAQGAFLISDILSDNQSRAPVFGSSLTVPGREAAVKTGTTDDSRDAWTIGYTPQLVVGVWVGNNDNAAMLNGGSGMAGPIWVNTMSQALQGTEAQSFIVPPQIVERSVCTGGGLAPRGGFGTYQEYFLSSALPANTCTPKDKPEKPKPKPEDEPEETQPEEPTEPDGPDPDEPTDPTDPSEPGGPGDGQGPGNPGESQP